MGKMVRFGLSIEQQVFLFDDLRSYSPSFSKIAGRIRMIIGITETIRKKK